MRIPHPLQSQHQAHLIHLFLPPANNHVISPTPKFYQPTMGSSIIFLLYPTYWKECKYNRLINGVTRSNSVNYNELHGIGPMDSMRYQTTRANKLWRSFQQRVLERIIQQPLRKWLHRLQVYSQSKLMLYNCISQGHAKNAYILIINLIFGGKGKTQSMVPWSISHFNENACIRYYIITYL